MKTTIKILSGVIGLIIVGSCAVFAKSIEGNRFSFGLEFPLPGGSLKDVAGTGFGVGIRYEMPFGDNFGATGTVSYLFFGSQTQDVGGAGSIKYTTSMIPILAGGKYYFTDQQDGFYISLQLGVSLLTIKTDETYNTVATSSSNSNSAFTWAPGIGYAFENVDLSVGYYGFTFSETVTTQTYLGTPSSYTSSVSGNWIGIRAAYVFGGL